jgi:hypothetical protein
MTGATCTCPRCGATSLNFREDGAPDICEACMTSLYGPCGCPRCGRPSNRNKRGTPQLCSACEAEFEPVANVFGETFAYVFAGKDEVDEFTLLADEELYAACRTNGARATKPQMAALHEALIRIVKEIAPCTVRQAFYQATVRGVVEKTEAGYDRVQRALVILRRTGRIAFRQITDNTRWQIKPTTYGGLQDALEETARLYRRAVWADVDAYVEVWLEKDALAGVVQPVTAAYDVGLMVARGFSSLSFLHSAAEDINALDRPAYIYHLGDRDPSGVCAAGKIEETLREFAPAAEIHFERLAVLPEQIAAWKLPTRPTKQTDSRARNFKGDSVELDAIHPDRLRKLVKDVIVRHLPAGQLETLSVAEESEREILRLFARQTEERSA